VPRVARIITRLNIGGPSIQALDLSRSLEASGFDTLLIHGRLGAGEGDMQDLVPAAEIRRTYVSSLVRPVSPLQDIRAFWRIYRELCRWEPDIVHTHMAKAGALGRLAAMAYNRTRGVTRTARLIHTYHGHVFEGYFGSPSTRLFLIVERWLARRTDVLIAISPHIRHDLLDTYQVARDRQVRVVPLGFDLDRFTAIADDDRRRARALLEIPADAIVVSTVGRLTTIKQHSLFLEMAGKLAARSKHFLFLIVGDGELRPALEAQARALGIPVRFLGWRGDLPTIYGASDIFVLTSRNEGTPVALIEAMAAGVASVSTDVGGVRDVITGPQVGTLVPFGDAEALAEGVRAFVDHPDRRVSVYLAARESVRERFHGRRLLHDIRNLYSDLLGISGTIEHEHA